MSSARTRLADLSKPVLTLAVAAVAAMCVWYLYDYYTFAPQTRDGRISADVVALAADVTGRVDDVRVHDNQAVHKGEVLFTIDRARLRNAVAQSKAAVDLARATLEAADRENKRYQMLTNADTISPQQRDARASTAEEAAGELRKGSRGSRACGHQPRSR